MKSFDKILDIIIAVIVFFFFPIVFFGQKQDALTQTLINTKTKELVNEVRSRGYLTKDRYDQYLEDLSKTGMIYDVALEHRQKILEPEYRLRTPEEVIEEQDGAYTGTNDYTYRPVTTDIPIVSDPISGSLNTETNESVLASSESTQASPDHVHTEACYTGHRHSGEPYFYVEHQHDSSCVKYTDEIRIYHVCNDCGQAYSCAGATYYWYEGKVHSGNSYYNINTCQYCGSSSYYSSNDYEIRGYAYSCGYDIDIDGDSFHDAVGTRKSYTYRKSSLPDNYDEDVKATYTNGCYQYHVHKYLAAYPKNIEEYDSHYSNKTNPLTEIRAEGGFDKFCYVPLQYSVSMDDDASNYKETVVCELEFLSNGTPRFHVLEVYNNQGSRYGHLDTTDKFPEYLSYSVGRSLYTSRYSLAYYLNYYLGTSYSGSDISLRNIYTGGINLCDTPDAPNGWYLTCGYEEEDDTPVCDQIVTDITPTNPTQTVAVGDPLITTATATYLNGSTNVVVGTTEFSTDSITENQTVTLTYNYTINGVEYSISCNITVSVIPRTNICIHGHTYNLNTDGSDPGCPYCKAWLDTLEIINPLSGSITIYKGTTLSENGVTLLATYLDGHTEQLYTEYADNLDMEYVGTQNVTISYKGKYVTLSVTANRNLIQCSECGRYYELYPDGTDPGCPFCLALTPIFTGNVMEYSEKRYQDEILDALYESNGIYYFGDKDYVTVTVKNRTKSIGTGIISYLYKNQFDHNINAVYGGYVRKEGG